MKTSKKQSQKAGSNISDIIGRLFKKDKPAASFSNPKEKLITHNDNFFAEESYKAVRTNIMFSLSDSDECKVIAITSPNQNEGKTTTIINTAYTFTQTDAKVLVIDADLRRANVHRTLGLPLKTGLSDILCGFSSPEKAIQKNALGNLDIISSGQIPPNPAELLASPKMAELINNLKQKYDYIFIDTPPVNLVTDATVLSKIVSGMIIVVRQNSTTYDSMEKALSALEFANTKILGVILNDVQTNDKGYVYKYADKYQYASDRNE